MMLFARNIYETTDLLVSTHVRMRGILSTYIAEHFFDYMDGGSRLRKEFLKHLQQLPQLERDIYQKRLGRLNAQLEAIEEPASSIRPSRGGESRFIDRPKVKGPPPIMKRGMAPLQRQEELAFQAMISRPLPQTYDEVFGSG